MLRPCHCDSLLLSPHRDYSLCIGKRVEKALPEVVQQWKGLLQVRQVLPWGYFKAGLPEMALAELPPKYIVSRLSQWAVAGVRAGQQRRRLK